MKTIKCKNCGKELKVKQNCGFVNLCNYCNTLRNNEIKKNSRPLPITKHNEYQLIREICD